MNIFPYVSLHKFLCDDYTGIDVLGYVCAHLQRHWTMPASPQGSCSVLSSHQSCLKSAFIHSRPILEATELLFRGRIDVTQRDKEVSSEAVEDTAEASVHIAE